MAEMQCDVETALPDRTAFVLAACADLGRVVDALDGLVDMLTERLAPVLVPPDTVPTNPKEGVDVQAQRNSRLAESIRSSALDVAGVSSRILVLMDRIDL